MKNKNIINNKNIIQILLENKKSKRRKKKSSQGEPISYMKDNRMESKPFNLVNSFPNSSQLEDQSGRVRFMGGIRNPYSIPELAGQSERVRFMEAMRDPFSTKSPYSIYDNGSNTFQREGNTQGAEMPVYPQLSQDDYFEQPPTRFSSQSARQFTRPAGRFSLNTDDFSDITSDPEFELKSLTGQDDSELPLYRSTDQSRHDSWFDPSSEVQDEIPDDKFGISGIQYSQPEQTRFSDRVEPPPAFSTPFRPQPEDREIEGMSELKQKMSERKKKLEGDRESIENLEMNREDIDSKLSGKLDDLQGIRDKMQQIKEKRRQQEEVQKELQDAETEKQAYEALEKELTRKKEINTKLQTVITDLETYIEKTEKEKKTVPKKGNKAGRPKAGEVRETEIIELPVKVEKGNTLRDDISKLITDKDFTEYTGIRNIKDLKDAQKLLDLLKTNSGEVLQRIEQLNKDKEESPFKRDPPRTSGNIQTFVKSAGGGGVSSGTSSRTKR